MKKLEELRKKINNLDQKLIKLLSQRMEVSYEIGKIKKAEKITIIDKKRWTELLETNLKDAEKLGLTKEFIKPIFQHIHKHSIKIQNKI